MAPASRSSGTVAISMLRSAWASQGNRFEVNSSSGTTTRAPAGSAAATRPSRPETVAPMATSSAAAPISPAKRSLAWSTLWSHGSQLVRPPPVVQHGLHRIDRRPGGRP